MPKTLLDLNKAADAAIEDGRLPFREISRARRGLTAVFRRDLAVDTRGTQ
jgi:hypothetical protein